MTPPTRQVLSIDLGELRSRVEVQAAIEGLRPGPWVKLQLERLLETAGSSPAKTRPDGADLKRRTDADFVKFTARLATEESEALAARAADAGLSQSEFVGRLIMDDHARTASNNAGTIVALTHSNHQLVDVARNLNYMVRRTAAPDGISASETAHVLAVTQIVREHLAVVSHQLAELQSSRRSRARDRSAEQMDEEPRLSRYPAGSQ